MIKGISFPALIIEQPIGTFYIGVMRSSDLVAISSADIREMQTELDDYMGIQRKLSPSRVKELTTYVNNEDATFPTSVILAIEQDNVNWDSNSSRLTLFPKENQNLEDVAKIIDGQHRVEGLKKFRNSSRFDVNVSIFVGADLATQANIFATVNLAQTKVNRSLVYDLYSYEHTRSPQKTCHDIAIALDRFKESPFYERIKRLGTATPGRDQEVLTQAAVVESVIKYISKKPSEDRNTFIKRLFPEKIENEELRNLIFRNMWLENKDTEIAQIIINFFRAVKYKWPQAWEALDRQGNVLPKTNGFKALIRFLKPVYIDIVGEEIGRVPSESEFHPYFDKIKMNDEDFNIETFPPGTSGEAKLYSILTQSLNKSEN